MSRRVLAIALVMGTIGALVGPSRPAFAFEEGLNNNFFGTGAGAAVPTGQSNSFFGGEAGKATSTGDSNSFFGRAAGLANTTGTGNSFFGSSSGQSNVGGSANSFFGQQAGGSNTSGGGNSFFGGRAGFANTTGLSNSFFGFDAGTNTTGSDNAFFGRDAGLSNTVGSNNAFFGRSAGASNDTGFNNAFFGRDAGLSNTAGSENAFFGRDAGASNTAGSENAFFGVNAGFLNTIGERNAFFGVNAGALNTTGESNAFFGRSAGVSNDTGFDNAFFGREAGASNTTEDANSFIGSRSDGVAGITNATAIGNQAQVGQSNSLVLGSIAGFNGATESVRVGIGTPTPAAPLHVRRNDGTAKVLVEEASETTLGRELFQLTNNGAARFRVSNTSNGATWDFQSSSGGGSFVIDRVGGPASLDFEMQTDGDVVVRGSATATSFITSSDRAKKTDITSADASRLMSLLRELDISTWRFKTEPEGTVNLGPMAQDFHRLFGMGTDTTIDIRDLAALALVAARELDQTVRTQRQQISEQTNVNDKQQKQIDELSQIVAGSD